MVEIDKISKAKEIFLVNDYGFKELELPYQEGYAIKRLPNPQPQAKYVKYVTMQ